MNYDQIMLDLETFGVGDNAAVVSMGAVRFSLDEVFETSVGHLRSKKNAAMAVFEAFVDLKDTPVEHLGVLDASTVLWWLEQSEEARASLTKAQERIPLRQALVEFKSWVEESPARCLWTNGPSFDERLLHQAFDRCGVVWPFRYNAGRDVRTMRDVATAMGLGFYALPDSRIAHKALDDALSQALGVIDTFRALKK